MAKTDKQKLAELLGIDAPDEEQEIKTERSKEAVLAYVAAPKLFQKLQCLHCSRTFRVNRRNVGYCCDSHRDAALEQMGFPKHLFASQAPKGENDKTWVNKNWDGNEPLIVPPDVLPVADEILSSNASALQQEVDLSDDAVTLSEQVTDLLPDSNSGISDSIDTLLNFTFDSSL